MAVSGGTGGAVDARLAGGRGGPPRLRPLVEVALDALGRGVTDRGGPLPGSGPDGIANLMSEAYGGELLPRQGAGSQQALATLSRAFAAGAADPAHPKCAAHLHCPPLALAVVADLVAATVNPSLDSWDQGPSGVALEQEVVRTLAGLAGYDRDTAGGSITSGGTESNLTALLLARDSAARTRTGRPRVLASAAAHFSLARGAGIIGLGEDAVLPVSTDADHRMDPQALRAELAAVRAAGDEPVAVVATAGTTDLGAIDPLPEIAGAAAEYGAWLHVDAAYGGGALFSDRLACLLGGLERADSVALDLHKLGWQPVAAGVLLTREAAAFGPLERRVAYLNPDDDEDAGYPSLLSRSIRTTRRPDAFKIAVTLRAYGRGGLGAMVDRCHDLARHAAAYAAAHPRLELLSDPVLTSVVFRYVPESPESGSAPDHVNATLRRVLLAEGRAVVGRTEAAGAVWLKLTLLNPNTTEAHIEALLDTVVAAGEKEEA